MVIEYLEGEASGSDWKAGNRWVYEGGDQTITVEVLDQIKLIEGVTCIVVNDLVSVAGLPIEETDDWHGQATNGDALPGIVMFGSPMANTVYRQEMSFGNAEDAAEVVSDDYAFGDDPDLDHLVPQELVNLLCDGDCVVTREFTPIAPRVEALKDHSPLVGLFLEVEDGEIVVLTECNVDQVVCAAVASL